jgi:serine protease Do
MPALAFVIDRMRPSIVQILAQHSGARDNRVLGTGFIIHADGYVLTAKHVVEAARALNSAAELHVGLAVPNIDAPISIRASFEFSAVEIVEEDSRHDLALLRITNNPFVSGRTPGVSRTADGGTAINAMWGLAPLNLTRPRDGDPIVVSGYPLAYPTLITTAGIVASAWDMNTMEVVPEGAPSGFAMPDIKDSYLADVAVNPGNSGGPVYGQEDGAVLGVCVAFRIAEAGAGGMPLRYNSGLSIVVPIAYGVELLGRHVDLGHS